MELDLLSWIDALTAPLSQEDHFKAGHLEELFRSKIAKSQATGKDGVRIGDSKNVWQRRLLSSSERSPRILTNLPPLKSA